MTIVQQIDEYADQLERDTLLHICFWIDNNNITDYDFSTSCGLNRYTWGKIARCDIRLSFQTIWKIASYYGYEAVGDIWAPYPESIFTPYPYEEVMTNIQTKLKIFKKVLKIRGEQFKVLREGSGFGHDHLMRILRGEVKGMQLRTVAGLTRILELERPGDLFKEPDDFFELYCR